MTEAGFGADGTKTLSEPARRQDRAGRGFWGLMFQVDPMGFWTGPEDLPVLLAILDLADKRLRQSRKEAEHG